MTKPRQAAKHERIEYQSLDGNWVLFPIGYCTWHKRYITEKQAKVHRCHLKHGGVCPRLQNLEGRSIRKVKTEQFYDKIVSRLDNLIGAVNKLTRTLEAMEKWRNGMCISLTDDGIPNGLTQKTRMNNYAKEKEDMGP